MDADSGMIHTVAGKAAKVNVNDVTQARKLVHRGEADVLTASGDQGAVKCETT